MPRYAQEQDIENLSRTDFLGHDAYVTPAAPISNRKTSSRAGSISRGSDEDALNAWETMLLGPVIGIGVWYPSSSAGDISPLNMTELLTMEADPPRPSIWVSAHIP